MERRNNSKRKPLSDLTNTTIINSKSDAASTGSNTIINQPKTLRSSPRNHPPRPSTTKLPSSLADSASVNYESRVYTSRKQTKNKQEVEALGVQPASRTKTKDKGKAVAADSFSCPPVERTRRFWDDIEDERSDMNENYINLSKTCTDGGPQRKKKRNSMPPALPRDFVEEQTKYFAEIDAFQLEEEAVSESELE